MDLLQSLLKGSGRWCHTVRRECRKSAQEPELQSLSQAEQILGKAIKPVGNESLEALKLRQQMAAPNDPRYRHMGEAETIAIMSSRFSDAVLMTDDRHATEIAKAQGLRVASTWKLLYLVCAAGLATEMEVLGFLKDLRHRGAPVLGSISELRSWMDGLKAAR